MGRFGSIAVGDASMSILSRLRINGALRFPSKKKRFGFRSKRFFPFQPASITIRLVRLVGIARAFIHSVGRLHQSNLPIQADGSFDWRQPFRELLNLTFSPG